jgi:hypothetical protein
LLINFLKGATKNAHSSNAQNLLDNLVIFEINFVHRLVQLIVIPFVLSLLLLVLSRVNHKILVLFRLIQNFEFSDLAMAKFEKVIIAVT